MAMLRAAGRSERRLARPRQPVAPAFALGVVDPARQAPDATLRAFLEKREVQYGDTKKFPWRP